MWYVHHTGLLVRGQALGLAATAPLVKFVGKPGSLQSLVEGLWWEAGHMWERMRPDRSGQPNYKMVLAVDGDSSPVQS